MNATYYIIVACFLTFGIILFASLSGVDGDVILENFGFSGNNLIARPWTIITSIFIHFDIGHLLSNMFVLLFFGTSVENEIGAKRMLLIFFAGAIAGDIFSYFFYPMDVLSIGASAGVFATVGMGMIIKPFDFSFYPFIVPLPLGIIGILYAVYNIIGFVAGIGNVSYIAHFGGLFVGMMAGFRQSGFARGVMTIIFMLILLVSIPLIILFFLTM